ncbi:putative phosphothreonine lyase domain-containg protein [Streptomyces sp. 769]|uniref:putative phosphothreonine lyase domain-containing protein n=1 Tax=Streptomyces sp. 769 TaxID=1262452 RepID=UPI0005822A59|nr:putative phosphothreonine lyase domain-containg protein [Streptomyces sp. 769]AJC62089.1 DNA polymerase II large subunit-like protein [Streptomyces sp. 769]
MNVKTAPSAQPEAPISPTPSRETAEYWLWSAAPHTPLTEGNHPRCGKWLWFTPISLLDASWTTIRTATEDGLLGYRSKAATLINTRAKSDDSRRPICVYTQDWRDLDDVQRVLTNLRALGIVNTLLYKTDSDTRLGRYGAGASTFVAPATKQKLVIPKRTRQALEHHHAARAQARRAATARKKAFSSFTTSPIPQ